MALPRSILDPVEPADRDLAVVAGSMPDGITGEIVISGPHPSTLGPPHAFYGAGLTYRLSLQPGTFGAAPGTYAWRHAWIDSPSARLQHARPELFQRTMLGVQSPFGIVNAANTAPLPWGDRLFTTWDVGRPVEVDPERLNFLGEVGRADEWLQSPRLAGAALPMVTSTAHPVIDPDRNCMWTVNTNAGALEIVRFDGTGPLRRWPITDAVIPQTVHTITQSRNWIIVGDCAFKVELDVLFGGERTLTTNTSEPIYLIRKDDLDRAAPGTPVPCRRYELAPEMNHYYAQWDDDDGVVVLFEHTENADIAMAARAGDLDAWGRPIDPRLAGLYGFAMTPSKTSLHRFDPETGIRHDLAWVYEPDLLHTRQLSAFDWSSEGWQRPVAYHSVYHGFRPEAVNERMLDLYRDRVDRSQIPTEEMPAVLASHAWDGLGVTASHTYSDLGDIPSSPIFVPDRAGHDGRSAHGGADAGGAHGWVVVPVLSDAGFRVEIFDASDVGTGPRCVLAAPRHAVPFFLHSAWMPEAKSAPTLPRTRFAEDLEVLGTVERLPDDLAAVAVAVARDLDEGVPMRTAPVS